MLSGSALALAAWLPLLAVLSQPSNSPQITPQNSPTEMPPSSLICVSKANLATFADVREGRCPEATTLAPADVWFAAELPAGAPDAVLYSSEIHALKRGELELSINGGLPRRVHTFDAIATRPYYDGRLSFPIATSVDRPTSLLLRMRILDERQLYRTERQVMLRSRMGMQQDQASHFFWQGVCTGLMLIMALYHAFLWRAERLAAAAWYCLTLCALALFFATGRLVLSLLPFAWAPHIPVLLLPSMTPLVAVCYLQFIRRYARLTPLGDATVRGMAICSACMIVLMYVLEALFSLRVAAIIGNLIYLLFGVLTLLAACVSAYHGDRESSVIAWSTLAPFCGIVVQIASLNSLLPAHGLASAAPQLGMTAQIIALGLALSDRIRRLRVDRDQAEAIVRLTLPDSIADRLKRGEKSIADRHAQVAVLFADLAGFTPLSASRDPAIIVCLLDALFSEFDTLAHRVGAEKIKTIGDCYMVVAGAPRPHSDPVAALADLALELPQAAERALASVRPLASDLPTKLPLRIGLHIGPVIAGVLGKQKLAYDLWGDTVNTASRMESHGIIGRVQCTQQVVEQLSDRYDFEPRGEITIRGKGQLPVWLLVGKKSIAQAP